MLERLFPRTPYRRRKRAAPAVVLLAFLIDPLWGSETASFDILDPYLPFALDDENRFQALDGPGLFRLNDVDDGKLKEGMALGVVRDALPERVYRVVTDNETFEEFMPFVKRSELSVADDGTLVNYQHLDLPWPIQDREYQIRLENIEGSAERPIWRSVWEYVPGSGNIADSRGSWTLVPHGDGDTLVLYRVLTDPGGMIPGWAQNKATKRALEPLLDSVRARVKDSRYD